MNLIFPKHCLGCRKLGAYLCSDCIHLIPPAEPVDVPDVFACFTYHDERVKRALWLYKYKQVRSIADDLAPFLHDRILEELAEHQLFNHREQKFLLVPVPLSRKRLRERGFNQAKLLAAALARQNPDLFELVDVIKKTRETHSQVSVKDRNKRLKNVRGAFALTSPKNITQRDIVIIDDVLTTGGTIEEVRKTLRGGKPRRVFGLVVAHG